MTGNERLDCQEMFRVACTFCECADLAQEKHQHDTADIGFYNTPSIVNSAFACEVFLKAILKFRQIKTPKAHKLKKLYDKLPVELRERIKQDVSCGYLDMWQNCFGLEYIDLTSNAFVEWRYIYEHDFSKGGTAQINIGFLNRFRDSLREICCEMFFGMPWEAYKRR